MLKRLLADMGIEEQRVRLEWISAAEGDKVRTVINEMAEQLRELGPLGLPDKVAAFLRVEGAESGNITLVSNDLGAAAEIVALGDGAKKEAVHVDGIGE